MAEKFDALKNYEQSLKAIGYVPLKKATNETFKRIGFKSGLEVHQQLKTEKKLFCNCPAGIFHEDDDYDAEIIRHMRPTLSELGEYDGTALMEFKTRKNITYRVHNDTTCTYEIDDTPPFPINKQALEYALEISLLSKLNIVGEVHITRKQYLDGSIPTGFQRTAILGVEGEIPLKNKKVRLIQLSIEEDACREISDIGHERIYKTDRLGTPLIETVTYPELFTPYELAEAAQVIRFLNRSTGKVSVGPGSGREDVNVSCTGGTRVEIKGVSYIKSIPKLSYNEAFRQFALLRMRDDILLKQVKDTENWKISHTELDYRTFNFSYEPLKDAALDQKKIIAVNLPEFKGALSHFAQPNKPFADEIKGRLKVIACLERPNMITSEEFEAKYDNYYSDFEEVKKLLNTKENDAQIIFWAHEEDVKTALEVIEERCIMAFEGIPQETRKSLTDGTTIFERVLPGADRMYPDTDSAPIPLANDYIENLKKNLPPYIDYRFEQLKKWQAPEDTFHFILRNNLNDIIEKIIDLGCNPKFVTAFFGHYVKHTEGKYTKHPEFTYYIIYGMFKYLKSNNIEAEISKLILPIVYQHPSMEFDSILSTLKFKKRSKNELLAPIDFLIEKFLEINKKPHNNDLTKWVMGQMHSMALGNIKLAELYKEVEKRKKEKLSNN